jgi:hypothetical protein
VAPMERYSVNSGRTCLDEMVIALSSRATAKVVADVV